MTSSLRRSRRRLPFERRIQVFTDWKMKKRGQSTKETHLLLRQLQIVKLLDFDMVDEAMTLAEKYRDMATLVQLVSTQLTTISNNLSKAREGSEGYARLQSQDAALHER